MEKKRKPFIHHIELNVTDVKRSIAFYDPVLKWLGFRRAAVRLYVHENLMIGIWRKTVKQERVIDGAGLHHLAFGVESKEEVDQFYNEVLLRMDKVKIKSPPKYCPEFGYEIYYATYFDDPDGNYLEVVYAEPISAKRYKGAFKDKNK